MTNELYSYLSDGVSFYSQKALGLRTVYMPLCGIDASSIKSSISPHLSGDIKVDKYHYLTKPVSTEDLRNPVRNFYVHIHGKGMFALSRPSGPDDTSWIEAGQLWHKLVRRHRDSGLEIRALNFVPISGETVELMRITITNTGKKSFKITPTAFIPIFGRALANKHDHEHVTSLLQRTEQLNEGVLVTPTMMFNEEGHLAHGSVYFVFGADALGKNPAGTFPTIESFCGDAGSWQYPAAVTENRKASKLSKELTDGKEAAGALRFSDVTLQAGKSTEFFIATGVAASKEAARKMFFEFRTAADFDEALINNKTFWEYKTHSIVFSKGNEEFNAWMRWVTLQPVLRRIFGNSYLPDHDYGKGGKGWRDLWQDLLSLILIEPEEVRENLLNNFAGIRIDGSNATIVGSKPGEFIADRNMITRVWMDHGAWPFLTTLLYINQTGDYDLLIEKATYFRDTQQSRTKEKDLGWHPAYGDKLKTKEGHIYQGTVLEHILVQNLVQFFNVGEHNITRLENADWNDGLDMAYLRGESVAFMPFYGANLLGIADLLERLAEIKKIDTVTVAKELKSLLDTLSYAPCDYGSGEAKRELLSQTYFNSVQPELSGELEEIGVADMVKDLRRKGMWIFNHIKNHEKISVTEKKKTFTWFNGYYDNEGRRVEGEADSGVRMTLTGQVFAVMSGLADDAETKAVIASVERYLRDKKLGGYRLNTDFGVDHYLQLGRAFGFAYGTKENGAFFSHMTVMYAYALYARGFARQGYEVLNSIFQMCRDSERSKIYPGIPEYFDSNGKGMYHYLTGSASWLVLTQLTQVFGVRGDGGDLVLDPKLVKEEFNRKGEAGVLCHFAGKKIHVIYRNAKRRDYGRYKISKVTLNGNPVNFKTNTGSGIRISRSVIAEADGEIRIQVVL